MSRGLWVVGLWLASLWVVLPQVSAQPGPARAPTRVSEAPADASPQRRAGHERAELPAKFPPGYTFDPQGPVRWIYPNAGESEVEELKSVLADEWQRLATQLGQEVDSELDIRIAVNPQQMQMLAPPRVRLPEYASGVALSEQGLILLTFTEPTSFMRPDMERVLIHELSHVALHRAVSGHPVPRWFSEGLALHQSGEHSLARIRTLWEGTLRGDLIPLQHLSVSFPARHGEVSLAYAQAADLVEHLLSDGASGPKLRQLIAAVRAGEPFEAAFQDAFGIRLAQLERSWRDGLTRRFGPWPSLLMGLSTVWALGALLLVIGYVRARRRHAQTLRRWAIEEAPMAQATPPPAPPMAAQRASVPPPPPGASEQGPAAWKDPRHQDSGVPKVIHEGRSHTLH